jgi:hypothetical protein
MKHTATIISRPNAVQYCLEGLRKRQNVLPTSAAKFAGIEAGNRCCHYKQPAQYFGWVKLSSPRTCPVSVKRVQNLEILFSDWFRYEILSRQFVLPTIMNVQRFLCLTWQRSSYGEQAAGWTAENSQFCSLPK